jgi:endonuclease/exonuclease/phosphatase family metal-dependent hydrolase
MLKWVRCGRAVAGAAGRSAVAGAMSLLSVLFVSSGCSQDSVPPTSLAPVRAVQHLSVMPVTPAAPVVQADARDVRVMSFNLRCPTLIDGFNHWAFRKQATVETIRKFDPDVLGTQECVLEQANYLRESLPDYEFLGVGRNDGKLSGEMCGLFFKKAKYERAGSGNFWLSDTPGKPGSKSWGSTFTRMVTWVKLRARDGSGQEFCVFNTHFDVWGKHARVESAKLLRREMNQIAGGLPCIVTGDFNDDDSSQTYRTMIAGAKVDAKLTDTFRVAHPKRSDEEGTQHSFHGTRSGPRIDWIFTTPAFETVAAGIDHSQVGSKYPSDHFPMLAIVRPTRAIEQTARAE